MRSTARANGWALIFGAIFVTPIAIDRAIKEYGPLPGLLLGCLAGAIWIIPGVLAIRRSRRMNRPSRLENLRFPAADRFD